MGMIVYIHRRELIENLRMLLNCILAKERMFPVMPTIQHSNMTTEITNGILHTIHRRSILIPLYFYVYSPCHEELEGLNGRHSVAVTFHCFLPRHIWQWDGESQMYMRFEGRELGNWKMNVGEFKQQRCAFSDNGDCYATKCNTFQES